MKLVMSILVKNEEDIIEDNIRFHAEQGVDAFYVMDNASDDATPEIIKALSSTYDITYEMNPGRYDQGPWMTYLAKQARKKLGADFVISNDADEFWYRKSGGSLKQSLNMSDGIVTVPRYNFVQSYEHMSSNQHYAKSCYKVVSPIVYSREDQLNKNTLSMPLSKISPKVIVSPKGLVKIKGGNHRAKHLKFWAKRFTDEIEVNHYPIRSYAQFEKNIKNRQKLLKEDPSTRMGVHYKRWVSLLEKGQLEKEFENISLSKAEIETLKKVGVIEEVGSSALSVWLDKVQASA